MAPPPDYYAILGVDPDASDAEITRAWRRLVLLSHPDKQRGDTVEVTVDIVLVNEARAVLSNPSQRKEFDEQFQRSLATSRDVPKPMGPRIREYVSLEEFTPHSSGEDEEPEEYTLLCRCGQSYVITVDDLEGGVDVVGCPGCGEYIGVDYEVVEE